MLKKSVSYSIGGFLKKQYWLSHILYFLIEELSGYKARFCFKKKYSKQLVIFMLFFFSHDRNEILANFNRRIRVIKSESHCLSLTIFRKLYMENHFFNLTLIYKIGEHIYIYIFQIFENIISI